MPQMAPMNWMLMLMLFIMLMLMFMTFKYFIYQPQHKMIYNQSIKILMKSNWKL